MVVFRAGLCLQKGAFIPLALSAQEMVSSLPPWLHLRGAFGPLLAACPCLFLQLRAVFDERCCLPGGILSGSALLTRLYNSTGGSLLAVILWHGTYNAVTAGAGPLTAAEITLTVYAAAIVAGQRYGLRSPLIPAI